VPASQNAWLGCDSAGSSVIKSVEISSDYKGWSCLHHAAAEGYTQTMKILLAANVKLLDGKNEDGVSSVTIPNTCGA